MSSVLASISWNDFLIAINWIVWSILDPLFRLICNYWIISIFTLIVILGYIADLVRSTREQ